MNLDEKNPQASPSGDSCVRLCRTSRRPVLVSNIGSLFDGIDALPTEQLERLSHPTILSYHDDSSLRFTLILLTQEALSKVIIIAVKLMWIVDYGIQGDGECLESLPLCATCIVYTAQLIN